MVKTKETKKTIQPATGQKQNLAILLGLVIAVIGFAVGALVQQNYALFGESKVVPTTDAATDSGNGGDNRSLQFAIQAVKEAQGKVCFYTIKDLKAFPRETVLRELKRHLAGSYPRHRLPLTLALAHFGEINVEGIIEGVVDAPKSEVDNLVAALAYAQQQALGEIKLASKACAAPRLWRFKTRLALLALRLEDQSIALEMTRSAADPAERTHFIDELSAWHGDLVSLATIMRDVENPLFLSAVCSAVGSVTVESMTHDEQTVWLPLVMRCFESGDAAVRSAAIWTMGRWGIPQPAVEPAKSPRGEQQWHVNGLGMNMVRISPGEFRRADLLGGSSVLHKVTLTKPFLLSDREVSVSQFQEFMNDKLIPETQRPAEWEGEKTEISPTQQHPVQRVSWFDAVLFCNWLSRREGLTPAYERTGEKQVVLAKEYDSWRLVENAEGYRLPTDAEFEYACRAGSRTKYCVGDATDLLAVYAVFNQGRTEACASKRPNAWGLFDMHGNVWEWCHDVFAQYGDTREFVDPEGPVGEVGNRVLRGGCFQSEEQQLQASMRDSIQPAGRTTADGFRVARSWPLN